MIKWRRQALHLGRFTLWHNDCRAICDTTVAELQNSVNLLCGTTAAVLKNMKAQSKVKFNSKFLKDKRFG